MAQKNIRDDHADPDDLDEDLEEGGETGAVDGELATDADGAPVADADGGETVQVEIEEGPSAQAQAKREGVDAEAKRKARREAKRRRNERFARQNRELNTVKQQLGVALERIQAQETRSVGVDVARLDQSIEEASSNVELSAAAMKESLETQGSSATFLEAQEARYNSKRRLEELTNVKRKFAETARAAATRPNATAAANVPHPKVIEHGRKWLQSNRWYNPAGGDTDSEIVKSLDADLAKAGWDPTSEDYWEELTDRVRERLPNRFRSERQPPANGGTR